MTTIYITDLDHTLLRSDHSISQYTQDIWNKKTKTNTLSIATARSFSKSLEFLDKLELHAPLILLDGAMVISPNKKLIDIKVMHKDLGDSIIFEGAKFGIYPFVIGLKDREFNESFFYTDTLNNIQKNVLKNYQNDPRLEYHSRLRAMEMTLKIVYFGQKEELTLLVEHLKNIFKDTIEYKLSPENYSNGYFLTLLHPDADKSHALKTVCNHLQQDLQSVTVFGDILNDIGMFKIAKRAIAVENALDELKLHADIILPHSNDQDGVAKYLAKDNN